MKKTPTLFKRVPNANTVLPEVTPGCEWVLAGEGTARRKYDGVCVMFDGTDWWARREVKPGKAEPEGFEAVQHDPATGKTYGWEPMEQSGFRKAFAEAVEPLMQFGAMLRTEPPAGTYELIGPKVNGNPEKAERHRLERHTTADVWHTPDVIPPGLDLPAMFEHLREFVTDLREHEGWEGIIWHHRDGRMVKLKARDFREKPAPLTCDLCPGEAFGFNDAILRLHQRNAHGQDV